MGKYLVYIKTGQTNPIRSILDPVKGYFPDIYLKVNAQGIRAFEMDHCKHALLYLRLNADAFEEFHCPNEALLGVSVLSLSRVFKNMDNEDVLILSVEEKNPTSLIVEIKREEHSKSSRVELKLMDLPYQQPPNQEITFDSIIKMHSTELQKLCREFKDYADNIEIINLGNQLRFRCSNDRLVYERIIGTNEKGIEYIKQEEPEKIIQGVFKLDYLVEFTKCANLSKYVHLHLQNDFPLILKYAVGSLGEIKLGVSPKLDEEDE
jgi:proliferating cell nuclear antigen